MGLAEYERKRDFDVTPEPKGRTKKKHGKKLSFVVQAHAARRMHYDFRLELDGVLLSWAVPKGPSLDPKVKRLAMHTEDHPLEYGTFEGIIPKGEYGGGTVIVWDRGTWEPEGDPHAGHEKGKLKFRLNGEKLRGTFNLVKSGGRSKRESENAWLLIKSRDDAARTENGTSIVEQRPESVITGRTLDEVSEDPDRVWHSSTSKESGGPARGLPEPGELEGAREANVPKKIGAQLATLVKEVPRGDRWLHEIKLDGYRILARIAGGEVTLLSRNGKDWTERMPSIARTLAALPIDEAVLDGELVVLDERGISDFQALQGALGDGAGAELVYYAFDLLHLNGYDLRGVPLLARKEALRETLRAVGAGDTESRLRFGDHVEGNGEQFYRNACEMGLEGIICKRADAPYVAKRSKDWLKVKCLGRQEFVIGGWTEPSGSRSSLGALLVGYYDDDGALLYAGKVGTGFTSKSLEHMLRELEPLEVDEPPFANAPRGYKSKGAHWVRPEKVCEVEFTEMTGDGKLRHPSFKGLREDKPAKQIHREEQPDVKPASKGRVLAEVDLTGFRLTNPDRVLYPEQGITKQELALYYAQVAEHMLPYVTGRLVTLVRCPTGRSGKCFYQKHAKDGMDDHVLRVDITEENGEPATYVAIDDVRGLLALVQMGVLEIHAWGSRVDRIERPDVVVMDLDPDEGLPWPRVVEAAFDVRARLEQLGLESFVKTTGGKGLHVVFPLERRHDWDEVKAFTKALAEDMERREPKKYVSNMSKAARKGRIFVDYLRNGRGATAVSPFSTRAREGAPVSTPLGWDELERGIRSDHFTVRTLPRRLAQLTRDPWEPFSGTRQRITAAMKRELRMKK